MTSEASSVKYEAVDSEELPAEERSLGEPIDRSKGGPTDDDVAGDDNGVDGTAGKLATDVRADESDQQNDDDAGGGEAEASKGHFCCWVEQTDCLIYSSQALSAWGDRMWSFAVALFLVDLEDNSLRLTAIFGFSLAISVLLFGALVGRWVDRTPRLTAVRTALLCQNSFVIVCAIILLFLLRYKDQLFQAWYPGLYLLCLLVILFGVIANLFSLAQKICIQKDWVVVLAGNNKDRLAAMNAMIRRIDLSVNILAPIIVGLIMNFAGMTIAAVYIAAWNVGSMIAEYFLLLKVYKKMPALARKGKDEQPAETSPTEQDVMLPSQDNQQPQDESDKVGTSTSPQDETADGEQNQVKESKGCCSWHRKFVKSFTNTYEAWKTYKSYTVSWAGMGIAMFYMTVMGFDSITNGYAYSLGVPEYVIGIMRALGSISGIIGTLLFPIFHRRIGLERTGLYATAMVILCLCICTGSIWAPGSLFDPFYYQRSGPLPTIDASTPLNYVVGSTPQFDNVDQTSTLQNSGDLLDLINSTLITDIVTEVTTPSFTSSLVTTPTDIITYTIASVTSRNNSDSNPNQIGFKECVDYIGVEHSYWTAVLFFGGQILQRMGLWVFDLVVTQSIQENIKENERGVFNGVQRSLECSMDMLHFILVIILPCPATFGFLIILSLIFVLIGSWFFAVYSHKIRGHLFHPEKFTVICHPHQNGGGRIPNGTANGDAPTPV
ncbi:solute carrier family 40 member 1-like [Amphiura filiformis]|uniref:solute carrier family 40 member 1-like n=1 Tax=Amphiura filiformis TaxID=82378 RepID=UPI003B2195DD